MNGDIEGGFGVICGEFGSALKETADATKASEESRFARKMQQ